MRIRWPQGPQKPPQTATNNGEHTNNQTNESTAADHTHLRPHSSSASHSPYSSSTDDGRDTPWKHAHHPANASRASPSSRHHLRCAPTAAVPHATRLSSPYHLLHSSTSPFLRGSSNSSTRKPPTRPCSAPPAAPRTTPGPSSHFPTAVTTASSADSMTF